MRLTVVTDGKDPLTNPARAYLERLGIPMHLVTRINVDSPHGDVQTVTVTLTVDTELAANPNMAAVPLLGQTRDEWPRTARDVRVAPLHRTCGSYHHMGTECPPTEPAPGSDGDTRDWPTDTIPAVDAVSHAPASCAKCGTLMRWNDGFGTWQHAGPGLDRDHDAVPV